MGAPAWFANQGTASMSGSCTPIDSTWSAGSHPIQRAPAAPAVALATVASLWHVYAALTADRRFTGLRRLRKRRFNPHSTSPSRRRLLRRPHSPARQGGCAGLTRRALRRSLPLTAARRFSAGAPPLDLASQAIRTHPWSFTQSVMGVGAHTPRRQPALSCRPGRQPGPRRRHRAQLCRRALKPSAPWNLAGGNAATQGTP